MREGSRDWGDVGRFAYIGGLSKQKADSPEYGELCENRDTQYGRLDEPDEQSIVRMRGRSPRSASSTRTKIRTPSAWAWTPLMSKEPIKAAPTYLEDRVHVLHHALIMVKNQPLQSDRPKTLAKKLSRSLCKAKAARGEARGAKSAITVHPPPRATQRFFRILAPFMRKCSIFHSYRPC